MIVEVGDQVNLINLKDGNLFDDLPLIVTNVYDKKIKNFYETFVDLENTNLKISDVPVTHVRL